MRSDPAVPIVFTPVLECEAVSPAHRDLRRAVDAAERSGFTVVPLPSEDDSDDLASAFVSVSVGETPRWAVWLGFIPDAAWYEDVYELAARRNVWLVNTPEQHLWALEFDRAYPLIADLTPSTVVLEHPAQWQSAEALGYPLFLKGSVRSRKEQGWSACIARDRAELQAQVNLLFRMPFRTRGKVLARQLVRLRHTDKSANGFPIGREFRVFLYNGQVLGLGCYWDRADAQALLTPDEQNTVAALAQECAHRLGVPFVAVDIGQTEAGHWLVIEVGDAQCAGYAQTPLLATWRNLYAALT